MIFELHNYNSCFYQVVKNIDREQVEQIKLGIVVEDLAAEMGTQLSYAFLTIIIDDVNDNSPVFKERFYKRSIAENSPMGTTIVNVAAIDRVFIQISQNYLQIFPLNYMYRF